LFHQAFIYNLGIQEYTSNTKVFNVDSIKGSNITISITTDNIFGTNVKVCSEIDVAA